MDNFVLSEQIPPDLELQIKVSKILSRGFVFSIAWMGGIGSVIAFLCGMKARKIIRESNGVIHGMRLAWWCIISGGLGMVGLPLAIFFVITSPLR
jgi:NADH:ubiquinone oxidoreductase subunit 5 (subunit L)/multisubunit Na+/H+ antiporter MnhA subunit